MIPKKKKLSDEIVASMWGKKVIANDHTIITETHIGNGMGQKFIDPITLVEPEVSPLDELYKQYQEETGKSPIYHGKVTKAFFKWALH